ncbi:MAG: class I SAM-dependent methyltransferase [Nitrospiraceae bacterium]
MDLARLPIYLCARGCELAASTLYHLASLFSGLLPALLSPTELSARIIHDYQRVYEKEPLVYDIGDETLESWEITVVERHQIRSGSMLVMGSGWGREALALARRGMTVVGIDTSIVAVKAAQRRAIEAGVPARFHQASFLDLPYKPQCFDYVLLASSMYSTIPTRSGRQAWLRALRRQLKPGGHVILSFALEPHPRTGLRTVRTRLSAAISKLPGTNHAYQLGDEYLAGHFTHLFQTEDEVRTELTEAGAVIKELRSAKGYAVLIFTETSQVRPIA